jgi:hypothetical protein
MTLEQVGILSDAHGIAPAFKLAVNVLAKHGATSYRFLGDAIGYVPSVEVLDSIIKMGVSVKCVVGNHEPMLTWGNIDERKDHIYQLESVKSQLTPALLSIIKSWPSSRRKVIYDYKALLVHDSPQNPTHN